MRRRRPYDALIRWLPYRAGRALDDLAIRSSIIGAVATPLEVQSGNAEASLVALGDICLADAVQSHALAKGPGAIGGGLRELLGDADLRVANLESVIASGDSIRGPSEGRLRADPSMVSVLSELGIDAVTAANNHSLDFGARLLAESIRRVAGAGISTCGTVAAEATAQSPAIVSVRGLRIGMLGYTDDYRPHDDSERPVMPALAFEEQMLADVAALRPRVDVLIVQLHWGYEFQLYPPLPYRDRARRLTRAGADAVLCHHAHVPLGLETHGRSLIAYGLGNAVFPRHPYLESGHPLWNRGIALRLGLSRHGVMTAKVVPVQIADDGSVAQCTAMERRRVLAILARISTRLDDAALLDQLWWDRVAREAVRWLRALAAAPDEVAIAAIATQLRLPRQEEIRVRLRQSTDPLARKLVVELDEIAGCGVETAGLWPVVRRITSATGERRIAKFGRLNGVQRGLPGRV